VVEKAVKKKKREVKSLSGTTRASKINRAAQSFGEEEENTSVPPMLNADQLIRMGRECSFDEKDGGEIITAAIPWHNDV
jgi:hypothetical protein